MPITDRTALGKSSLKRDWFADINTGTYEAPVWVPINGIKTINPRFTQFRADVRTSDNNGYGNSQPTGADWALDLELERGFNSDGEYDPAQEAIRLAVQDPTVDDRMDIRFFQNLPGKPGYGEAYRGYASPSWEPIDGDDRATDKIRVAFEGQGERFAIDHPGAP